MIKNSCKRVFTIKLGVEVHDKYLQFIVCDSFKCQNDQWPDYFDEFFCSVGEYGVITCSFNKKIRLPFRETKHILCGT